MSTSPGWYPDPAAPETQRYWDGEQWVGEPIPAEATPPDTPPAPKPPPPVAEIQLPPGFQLPPGVRLPPGVVVAKPEIPEGFRAASLERRLGARLLDVLAIVVLCGLANLWLGYRYVQLIWPYLRQVWRDPESQPEVDSQISTLFYGMVFITLAVWFAYEVVATHRNGQTLGKRLLRIKVVALDGAPVDFRASMRRWMVMAIPFVFPCCLPLALIDVLWCTWDRPLAQCVHDKSARTIVVSAKPADLPDTEPSQ